MKNGIIIPPFRKQTKRLMPWKQSEVRAIEKGERVSRKYPDSGYLGAPAMI